MFFLQCLPYVVYILNTVSQSVYYLFSFYENAGLWAWALLRTTHVFSFIAIMITNNSFISFVYMHILLYTRLWKWNEWTIFSTNFKINFPKLISSKFLYYNTKNFLTMLYSIIISHCLWALGSNILWCKTWYNFKVNSRASSSNSCSLFLNYYFCITTYK